MTTTTASRHSNRSAVLSYLSLFTSLSTLLCCALPSLLVLFGLGSSIASLLSFMPWLVSLSRHKAWTFSISGALIALSFVNMYYLAPRLRPFGGCDPADLSTCRDVSQISKILLWAATVTYAVGFFVAYALGPILTRLDQQ